MRQLNCVTKDQSSEIDDLARCITEQQAAKAYLDGDGADKEGAQRGLEDWHMEEALIRLEQIGMAKNTRPPNGCDPCHLGVISGAEVPSTDIPGAAMRPGASHGDIFGANPTESAVLAAKAVFEGK